MKKTREATPEERLQIVRDCLEHNRNYGAMALKYQCSYQQVRNWDMKYEEMGCSGLRNEEECGVAPAKPNPGVRTAG